jgi:hypothetical protein
MITVAGEVSQSKAGAKEYCDHDSGGSAQQVGCTRYAEQAAGCAATEGCAHIGTFTVLQQYQADDTQRCDQMYYPDDCFHLFSLPIQCSIT